MFVLVYMILFLLVSDGDCWYQFILISSLGGILLKNVMENYCYPCYIYGIIGCKR